MLLQDTIGEHLLEVEKAAREQEEVILKQLEEKKPLPDKEKDQMAWVRVANQHRAIAECESNLYCKSLCGRRRGYGNRSKPYPCTSS